MLAMARAVMGRPRLLMLDEPSMGLAPIVVAEIYRQIAALRARGVTILLVEQNANIALEHADRALLFSAGELRYEGTAAAVRNDRSLSSLVFGHWIVSSCSLTATWSSRTACSPVSRSKFPLTPSSPRSARLPDARLQ
jgi:ABC-type Mn2+/Zn2+ transport system ATPase subunit